MPTVHLFLDHGDTLPEAYFWPADGPDWYSHAGPTGLQCFARLENLIQRQDLLLVK
jgi:hypothetical protein